MKFKQRAIMVDAIQWDGNNFEELKTFTGGAVEVLYTNPNNAKDIRIGLAVDEDRYNREYSVPINLKDWIVRDIDGAFYPCKDKIFQLIYEELSTKEKILNGIKLSYEEVSGLIWEEYEDLPIQTTVEGDDTRWQRYIDVVIKVDDRFFMLYYMQGLTEFQDNDYEEQVAVEVVPVQVMVTDWKVV